MSTRILGISAFYHDSAAAVVVDGARSPGSTRPLGAGVVSIAGSRRTKASYGAGAAMI